VLNPELTALLQQTLPEARAELMAMPQTPVIELFLLNADFPQHGLSREQMHAVMAEPAYWAFCWASGQVMAKLLLDCPELVRGKRVLDFGSGSGVVAIAAAKAGAAEVIACDIDSNALLATRCNAEYNQVAITLSDDIHAVSERVDMILAADVLYDRENLPWLDLFLKKAEQVLVADSRVKNFQYQPYRLLTRIEGTTVPDLDEFDEFRDVRIYGAGVDI
jgi:predicted nicotinamide N-methyase